MESLDSAARSAIARTLPGGSVAPSQNLYRRGRDLHSSCTSDCDHRGQPLALLVLMRRSPRTTAAAPDPVRPVSDGRLRLEVRLRRRPLDRALARGAPTSISPAHSVRAAQLESPAERRALARCFEQLLAAAEECTEDPGSSLRLNHMALHAAAPEVRAVVGRLRDERPADVRGIALARTLIDERSGPLFTAASSRTLQQALAEILLALEGEAPASGRAPGIGASRYED